MSEEVNRMLDEVERKGDFIGATYEVERLSNIIDEMNRAMAVTSEQLSRFSVELEEERGMSVEDMKWARETEESQEEEK